MARQKTTERKFKAEADRAGFRVRPPKSIRLNKPVADKEGKKRKRVTVPDFYITDPETNQDYHVEVTDSSGTTPHKEAQRRVVNAAGVTNYVVITGDDIARLESETDSQKKGTILRQIIRSALNP